MAFEQAKAFSLNYTPSRTAKLFHLDDSRVRCLIGPVGSGKSVACVIECALRRAIKQEPDPDGVRRTRGVMIRNTYNQLLTTTIKTFKDWFGHAICTYKADKPLSAIVHFDLDDGTKVECEVLFLALDKEDDTGKIRGLEITWAYINEASEIRDYSVMEALSQRIGRYPKQYQDENGEYKGGPTWVGIVIDTNPSDDEHWIYSKFEVEKPDGFKIFHQPPAVVLAEGSTIENPIFEKNEGQVPGIPPAENIEHLGKKGHGWDYYMNQIPGMSYEQVRVMLMAQYGTIAYGRAVYQQYKDRIHYLPNKTDPKTGKPMDVTPMFGLPVILGFDFGIGHAACVIAQLSPLRQLRVLEEIVVKDMSTREFGDYVRAKLFNEYKGMKVIAVGDPAGNQRKSTDSMTDITILNECGIPVTACLTNSPKQRVESVVYFLTRLVEEQPGLVLSSKCPMLRKGFAGRYYYNKVSTSAREEIYRAEPCKNEYSHPHDALQYIATSLIIDENTREAAMRTPNAFGSISSMSQMKQIPTRIDSSALY